MAKSATKTQAGEEAGSVEFMAEPERLAAISKVRLAYERLVTLPDRSEALRRRVKLLEVWRDLVAMREAEPSAPVEGTPEPVASQTVSDVVEVLPDAAVEDASEPHFHSAEQPSQEEHGEPHASGTDDLVDPPHSVHAVESLEEPPVEVPRAAVDLVIHDQEPVSQSDDLVIVDAPHEAVKPVDVVIAEAPPAYHETVDFLRVRLRLIKPGYVHDMLLPEGTIVSVYPADAEELVNQGTAEILLVQDDEE